VLGSIRPGANGPSGAPAHGTVACSPSGPEGQEEDGLADPAVSSNCQESQNCRRVRHARCGVAHGDCGHCWRSGVAGSSGATARRQRGRRDEHKDEKGSSSDAVGWTGAHRRDGASVVAEG
jgi:hypothetical protein